ncbi:ZIP Zinc transporter family protein [Tritrichomonas foetus]|uniref:ZIP Zinc transporter family protein n=1 Tax=Tritrichomonas foetus TaxID=1144522 RepID=A0A1J4JGD1_9EUKA|nr:ZIP Zinc transporter family protein [Tritrichomonas foetus]|eukprot:OHS98246.1 ZIP Zinc transporter family protein [Tritrichomonas foetus]
MFDFSFDFIFEDTNTFKFYIVLGILMVDLVMIFLPFYAKSQSWIALLESLAGGIFLSAACVHLIPESLHTFKHVTKLPLAPIIWVIVFSILMIIEMFAHSHNHDHDHDHDIDKIARKKKDIRHDLHEPHHENANSSFYVLYLVLIFHECVESISMGGAKSKKVILALYFATIGHKPVETFSLGLTLLKNHPSKVKYFTLMILFALVSPLTILGVTYFLANVSELTMAIVASVSAGTFLFVGFQELSELFHHSGKMATRKKIQHIIAFLVGSAWMCAISLGGHEHHHHHHH